MLLASLRLQYLFSINIILLILWSLIITFGLFSQHVNCLFVVYESLYYGLFLIFFLSKIRSLFLGSKKNQIVYFSLRFVLSRSLIFNSILFTSFFELRFSSKICFNDIYPLSLNLSLTYLYIWDKCDNGVWTITLSDTYTSVISI